MKRSADCIVIGGGVIGLSVARELAGEGFGVTVFDRGPCGREASWAGAGVLTPPNPHRTDPAAGLVLRGLAMYEEFCEQLHNETGVECEYERCAEIELAFDERGLSALREDVQAAANRRTAVGESNYRELTSASGGVAEPVYQMLSPVEAQAMEPAVSSEIVGAMICRAAAQVRNPRLLRAIFESCRLKGVAIRENTPVVELIGSGGRVTGVRVGLDGQESVSADRVILGAGAWSSQLSARIEALMPVVPVRGQMVLLKLEARPFSNIIARGRTYLVPRRDGHVLLGATEERDSGFSKRNTAKGIASLISKGIRLAPILADAPIVATWAGLRPGTPDDLPYIGPVPGFDGLIAATGHFRTGLSAAPATAEAVLKLVKNEPFEIDLTCCLPGRALTQTDS